MTLVSSQTASKKLFARNPDQHFASHADLWDDAKRSLNTGKEVIMYTKDTGFHVEAGNVRMRLSDALPSVGLTPYSMAQILLPLKGINVDTFHIPEGLTAATDLLNAAWKAERAPVRSVLMEADEQGPTVRCITSANYDRVWDADILEEVDRWLIPSGFSPTMPTINTDSEGTNIFGDNKPALFRSDRDMFAFYTRETKADDADEFGGLSRGFIVSNSEVGAGKYIACEFIFRGMCANFLIWNADKISEQSAWHKGKSASTFHRDGVIPTLQRLADETADVPMEIFAKAAEKAFAGDGTPSDKNMEDAAKRLQREFKVGKKVSERAVASSLDPINQKIDKTGDPELTHFTVAQGLTWEAKSTKFADSLFDAGMTANAIMTSV